MRVPSIGMTLADRRDLREIVREGYALADRLLANYRDPPGLRETLLAWLDRITLELRSLRRG